MQLRRMLVCCALLCAVGCLRSTPPKFFVLKAMDAPQAPAAARQLSIGVGPVDVPDYLRRTQIARRTGGNEIAFSDAYRWAEPLDTGLLRVLAENLSQLLGTKTVALFPWLPSATPDYQVQVRFVQFDGSAEIVRLAAYWSILEKGNSPIASGKSLIHEKPASGDMATLVQAQNSVLDKLSSELAGELKRVSAR